MKSCVALTGMMPLGGATETRIAGTVTVAVSDLVVSVTDVAITFTARSLTGGPGAVYVIATPLAEDDAERVPQGVGEQVTVHVTPLFPRSLPTVAVSCAVVVASTVAVGGCTSTVIAGTVIVAEAVARELDTEVAVTVTVKSLGGGAGAVYVVATPVAVDVGATLPHGAVEQDTVHVTPLLLGSPATVAINCTVAVSRTVAVVGATDTPTDGIVMVADADFVLSVIEVAVSVTVKLLAGGTVGAVYVVVVAGEAGDTVPHGAVEQLTVQFTPAFAASKLTVALNCTAVPTWTVTGVGATETVMASIVIIVEAVAFEFCTDFAVRVTVRLPAGAVTGAVYVVGVPLGVEAGEILPHCVTEQDTVQVTP